MKFEITIEKYAPPGIGLGYFEEKAVFVPASAVGDRLLVEWSKEKKSHAQARILEVLQPGPERIEALCPHYLECGGCDLLHLDYARQLELKAQMLTEILTRQGIPWQGKVLPSPEIWNYRYKANLKLEMGRKGLNRHHSAQVVEVPQCRVLALAILAALPKIEPKNLPQGDLPLLASLATGQVAGMIQTKNKLESLPGFSFSIQEDFGFGRIELWAANFAQANPGITKLILADLLEAAQGYTFATELYAGSGTLTHALAKTLPKVLALEGSEKAIKVLERNREALGLTNLTCRVEDAHKSKLPKHSDLVVVDPPRAGLEAILTERICQSPAKGMLYMSCNPATQARDLKILVEQGGFALQWLRAYDMYAHSSHLETLAYLTR